MLRAGGGFSLGMLSGAPPVFRGPNNVGVLIVRAFVMKESRLGKPNTYDAVGCLFSITRNAGGLGAPMTTRLASLLIEKGFGGSVRILVICFLDV